jgi:hypothetical protein
MKTETIGKVFGLHKASTRFEFHFGYGIFWWIFRKLPEILQANFEMLI